MRHQGDTHGTKSGHNEVPVIEAGHSPREESPKKRHKSSRIGKPSSQLRVRFDIPQDRFSMEATESETSSLEAFDRTVLDTRKENRGGNAGKLLDSPSTMENTTGPEGIHALLTTDDDSLNTPPAPWVLFREEVAENDRRFKKEIMESKEMDRGQKEMFCSRPSYGLDLSGFRWEGYNPVQQELEISRFKKALESADTNTALRMTELEAKAVLGVMEQQLKKYKNRLASPDERFPKEEISPISPSGHSPGFTTLDAPMLASVEVEEQTKLEDDASNEQQTASDDGNATEYRHDLDLLKHYPVPSYDEVKKDVSGSLQMYGAYVEVIGDITYTKTLSDDVVGMLTSKANAFLEHLDQVYREIQGKCDMTYAEIWELQDHTVVDKDRIDKRVKHGRYLKSLLQKLRVSGIDGKWAYEQGEENRMN